MNYSLSYNISTNSLLSGICIYLIAAIIFPFVLWATLFVAIVALILYKMGKLDITIEVEDDNET